MEKEDLILLATYIAMELSRDKDFDDIILMRDLCNQICCSLSNLLNCKKKG